MTPSPLDYRPEAPPPCGMHVGQALAAFEKFEVPLAGWQVHATAANGYRARGETAAATRHREFSRGILRKLEASRGLRDPAHTFLMAPSVRKVLGEPGP